MRVTTVAFLTAILFAGCGRDRIALSGSRFAQFGAAELFTQLCKDRTTNTDVALGRVLFIPDVTPDHLKLDVTFQENSRSRTTLALHAHDVHVLNGRTVQADGRPFDLSRGNTFIVHVHPDGSLQLTQLPDQPPGSDDRSVVEAMKRSAPGDARLQALKN